MFFGLVTGLALALGAYWGYNELTKTVKSINMLTMYDLPSFMKPRWNEILADYYGRSTSATKGSYTPKLPANPSPGSIGPTKPEYGGGSGITATTAFPAPEFPGGGFDLYGGMGDRPGGGGPGMDRPGGGPGGPGGPRGWRMPQEEKTPRRMNAGLSQRPNQSPKLPKLRQSFPKSPNGRPVQYEKKNTTFTINGTRYYNLDNTQIGSNEKPAKSLFELTAESVNVNKGHMIGRGLRVDTSTPVNLLTRLRPLSIPLSSASTTRTTEYNYDYERHV